MVYYSTDPRASQWLDIFRKMIPLSIVSLSLFLFFLGGADLLLGISPILVGALLWLLWVTPMQLQAYFLLFVGLLLENPSERPGHNMYHSPFYEPGRLFFLPLEKSLHLAGLKITGIELLILSLLGIALLRRVFGSEIDGKNRLANPVAFLRITLVTILSLFFLECYGMLRGGNFNSSILQIRTILFLPVLTLFFSYALKSFKDVQYVLITILTVAWIRAVMCIYYYWTVIKASGASLGVDGDGSYVTTHSDTILWAVALIIVVAFVYESPTLFFMMQTLFMGPPLLLAMVYNNRRIVFVAVALGLMLSTFAARQLFKLRVRTTLWVLLPFLLCYVAAGWRSKGSWAKPVQSLRSVFEQKDSSSATRDIENYNLLQTFRQHPLIGSGFGHQYLELQKAFDISSIFEAYRYVPHNSILWFWGVGGLCGTLPFWFFLAIGVFFSARLCLFAKTSSQSVAGMAGISSVCAYCMQCFGDMGLMSWTGNLVVASLIGLIVSMNSKLQAWPFHLVKKKYQPVSLAKDHF